MASIGFAFDIYELLMAPLILPQALPELTGLKPPSPDLAWWRGALFYIPALAGGIFGLLGGYLTDRLGRRRVLTWSILLYACSAFFAGFSTSVEMLLVLRCTTFIGVCVEFVAAVAWLAELFPEPKQREKVLGYTQAFSSVGGLLVAVVNGVCVDVAPSLPAISLPDDALSVLGGEIKDPHAAWRYTLMSGLIPALPLVLIRPFLPESPVWRAKKEAGTLKRPSLLAIFAPQYRRTTITTSLLFAMGYGAAFGAIQQTPEIVKGLPEVLEAVAKAPADQKTIEQTTAKNVTTVQEVGGLTGRFLLAVLAVHIVGRRRLLRIFQLPGLVILPLVFAVAAVQSLDMLYVGIFFAGLCTVGQFSFWGNYLPRVYPVHLRGTGESFAANIGGRMIGTSFAWVTSWLAIQEFVPGSSPSMKMAYTAAAVAFFVFAVGTIICFWLPEPPREQAAD
jgi:MFS family permease